MRPSPVSLTLDPGLDRGVPCGPDLFTFVTSAAGHMMRTLQKPRKNRPSKRQVNHRRFLQNMIQRKFADIEAANHRLASALYDKDEDKNLPTEKAPQSPPQPDHPDKVKEDAEENLRSDGSREAEMKQQEQGPLWKRNPKSQSNSSKRNKQDTERQRKERRDPGCFEFTAPDHHPGAETLQSEFYDCERPLGPDHIPPGDPQKPQQDSGFTSPSFSPDLSPLSFDSCDFSVQMFTDVSAYTQRNGVDVSEQQWTDITDLFNVGSKDLDVEAYLENICTCEADALEGDVGVDGSGFADQFDCGHGSEAEAGGYTYDYGYGCHGDQGLIGNHFQRPNEDAAETRFTTDMIQLPVSMSYGYSVSELQPFEGVAQSFPVPLHSPEQQLNIAMPPQDDDWLFTDILTDRKSPGATSH